MDKSQFAEEVMRYQSIATIQTDPYLAGFEIGRGLRPLRPEVILLFASVSYEPDFSDFFAGLEDALEGQRPLILGGTGDGFLETGLAANYGVSALGMTSDQRVRWSLGLGTGVQEDSRGAALMAAQEAVRQLGCDPGFCFVMADGAKADGTAIVRGLREAIRAPFFGGLSGDDRRFTHSRVFHQGRAHDDAVALLMGAGPLPFAINAASGWRPTGESARVDSASGSTVRRIGGLDARTFMTRQTGRPLGGLDMGIVPLADFEEGMEGRFFLRTPSAINEETGEVTVFGSIEEGALVQVCTATRAEVLAGVDQAVAGLLEPPPGFTPQAALLVSCAGRKWMLEDDGTRELAAFHHALGTRVTLAGFPSFGEIGPFRQADGSHTPPCFHNVTFVACLLG